MLNNSKGNSQLRWTCTRSSLEKFWKLALPVHIESSIWDLLTRSVTEGLFTCELWSAYLTGLQLRFGYGPQYPARQLIEDPHADD